MITLTSSIPINSTVFGAAEVPVDNLSPVGYLLLGDAPVTIPVSNVPTTTFPSPISKLPISCNVNISAAVYPLPPLIILITEPTPPLTSPCCGITIISLLTTLPAPKPASIAAFAKVIAPPLAGPVI